MTNNADKLHHYWVTVTPHTNFMVSFNNILRPLAKNKWLAMNVSEHFNASVKENIIMKFTFQFFIWIVWVKHLLQYCSVLVSYMYFNDLLIALLTIKTKNCKERLDSKVEVSTPLLVVQFHPWFQFYFCTVFYVRHNRRQANF